MLGIQELWLFILSGLLLNITPGPDTAYIIGRSIQLGWRGGAAAAIGISAGCIVHVLAAAIGLSALLMASSTAFAVLKLAGAAYLLFTGVRMLLSRASPLTDVAVDRRLTSLSAVFWQGALTNILNPKVALFFLAFLPQFVEVDRGHVAMQIAFLGLIFTVLGVMTDGCYALAAGAAGNWLKRSRAYLRFERYVSGALLIGLGVTAAFAGNQKK